MKRLFFCLMMILPVVLYAKSIDGLWTTVDDETDMPRAIVKIYEQEGKWYGRILRVYKQGDDRDYCAKCKGSLKNKPIIGLRFLWGMKQKNEHSWSGGRILDPKSGHIYRCKMTLSRDEKKLFVRGYFGLSVFGRTQTWVRRTKLN